MNKNSFFILTVLVLCIFAQFSLMSGIDWFQFAREDIEAGQWWRFITGNLVHLNWRHFAMNSVALIAIYILFPDVLKITGWVLVFLINCMTVTVGIWLFSPEIYWYVGLSGTLHGLVVVLLLLDFITHKNLLNLILFVVLLAKLVWEAWMGPIPGSEQTAGGPVIVQAHFYGFIGGLLSAMSILFFTFNKNKKLQ